MATIEINPRTMCVYRTRIGAALLELSPRGTWGHMIDDDEENLDTVRRAIAAGCPEFTTPAEVKAWEQAARAAQTAEKQPRRSTSSRRRPASRTRRDAA